MARLRSVLGLLRALAALSWRDVRSFRSIGGQNFSLFLAFVALQPESAEFLLVLLSLILLFPLSTDPMAKLPPERRATWPLARWEWLLVRAGSFLMNPIVWIALPFLLHGGWRFFALFLAGGLFVQLAKHLIRLTPGTLAANWLKVIPAPRGMLGVIMRLHWRADVANVGPVRRISLGDLH